MCKWMALFLKKNDFLRCWDLVAFLNWIGALTLYLLLKLSEKKGASFLLGSFFPFISVNLLYGLAWNTVFMSGLLVQAVT